jgi:hypothetical protein
VTLIERDMAMPRMRSSIFRFNNVVKISFITEDSVKTKMF